jgi:hypothetical protein
MGKTDERMSASKSVHPFSIRCPRSQNRAPNQNARVATLEAL